MGNQIKILTWTGDAGDVNIPIGFDAHHVRVIQITDSAPKIYEWFRLMEQEEASGSQEGLVDDGAGTTGKLSDSQGITAYDAASQLPTIAEWTEAGANASSAKTVTARGSFFKATVGAVDDLGLVVDRSAIFEVVTTDSSGGSSEPVWPSVIGERVDSSGIIFERVVDVALERIGYMGIVFSSQINENSKNYYMIATEANDEVQLGDVDGWPSGVKPD